MIRSSDCRPSHWLALVVLTLSLVPIGASGQGIHGSLLDLADDRPIAGASVALIDSEEEVVDQVVTDALGRFRVSFPRSGRYYLRADRIGYVETASPPLDLRRGDSLVVELHMSAEAVTLAPLTVQVAPSNRLRSKILDGFYHRERRGWGTHYGPEEIERIRPARVSNLLQNTRGVQLRYMRTRTLVTMRSGTRDCVPTVLIDGMRAPGGQAGVEVDHWVPVSALRAMEVYARSIEVPGEFAGRINETNCGVILLWTTMSMGR